MNSEGTDLNKGPKSPPRLLRMPQQVARRITKTPELGRYMCNLKCVVYQNYFILILAWRGQYELWETHLIFSRLNSANQRGILK